MVALQTPRADLNWQAPNFSLSATDGKIYKLNQIKGQNGTLVMFICNHCPFVKAILDKLIKDVKEMQNYGIGVVAIMSNDTSLYEEDSFENMQKLTTEKKLPFPYLWDKTQEIAKNYGAICTPDFFGFDKDLKLQYRGRFDESGMKPSENSSRDLFHSMVEVSKIGKVTKEQLSSIGCSIKWKN